jgi:hypothetical protein
VEDALEVEEEDATVLEAEDEDASALEEALVAPPVPVDPAAATSWLPPHAADETPAQSARANATAVRRETRLDEQRGEARREVAGGASRMATR